MAWSIGILGAGPDVAALHLPVLEGLADLFRVVHVADAGSGRAQALAERSGARWSTGEVDLLADPAVDVVAICSPPQEHARQILAALAAGKRAIFCEKPWPPPARRPMRSSPHAGPTVPSSWWAPTTCSMLRGDAPNTTLLPLGTRYGPSP